MTAPPRLPDGYVFTGTPEQILTDIYTRHSAFTEAFIASRLPHRDRQLTEDLTQETFVQLWASYVSRGVTVDDRVRGLLATIARQRICAHFRRSSAQEVVTDVTDPATVAARTLTAPASTTPHLAALYGELEHAKNKLTEAAAAYTQAKRAVNLAKGRQTVTRRPEKTARWAERLKMLAANVDVKLADFQAAATRVAQLRAAWNQAADNTPVLAVSR